MSAADPRVDDLGRALLALAREVWVLRDRQRILEAVLEQRGIAVADAVERFQPDPELQARLEAERRAFVDGFLRALAPDQPHFCAPRPVPPPGDSP
jgi:hypothetical protein